MDFEYKIKFIKRLGNKWYVPLNFFIMGQRFDADPKISSNFLPSLMTDSQIQTTDKYFNKIYGTGLREIELIVASKKMDDYDDKFSKHEPIEDEHVGMGASYKSEKDEDTLALICWDGIRRALYESTKDEKYSEFSDFSELPEVFYTKKIFDKKTNKMYDSSINFKRNKEIQELYEQGYIDEREYKEFKNE
tara:strand:- start:1913 stop:2485 length:573 start_codon:yes stop_codon:yes gene_type:complete